MIFTLIIMYLLIGVKSCGNPQNYGCICAGTSTASCLSGIGYYYSGVIDLGSTVQDFSTGVDNYIMKYFFTYNFNIRQASGSFTSSAYTISASGVFNPYIKVRYYTTSGSCATSYNTLLTIPLTQIASSGVPGVTNFNSLMSVPVGSGACVYVTYGCYSCSPSTSYMIGGPVLSFNFTECSLSSHCGSNQLSTCSSAGFVWSCNQGICSKTITPITPCPNDIQPTCFTDGQIFSCSSGICYSTTRPRISNTCLPSYVGDCQTQGKNISCVNGVCISSATPVVQCPDNLSPTCDSIGKTYYCSSGTCLYDTIPVKLCPADVLPTCFNTGVYYSCVSHLCISAIIPKLNCQCSQSSPCPTTSSTCSNVGLVGQCLNNQCQNTVSPIIKCPITVQPTCDSEGTSYNCVGGTCLPTSIPRLICECDSNRPCLSLQATCDALGVIKSCVSGVCITTSSPIQPCPINILPSCSQTGVIYTCVNSTCISTVVPIVVCPPSVEPTCLNPGQQVTCLDKCIINVLNRLECSDCKKQSDCGDDVQPTCQVGGRSFSCVNGLCKKTDLPATCSVTTNESKDVAGQIQITLISVFGGLIVALVGLGIFFYKRKVKRRDSQIELDRVTVTKLTDEGKQ